MTSVLGGRGTVITGLSVGEGGRGGRKGREGGEGRRVEGRERKRNGESEEGREGREKSNQRDTSVCTNRKCICKIRKTVSQVVASMN